MVSNLIFITGAVVLVYVSRVFFDAFVLHKRLRLSFNKKLLSVAFFTNSLALMVISIASMPLIEHSWAIFLIQILFLMGIEAPVYQIYYRNKSWYNLCISLLIARLGFALIAIAVGIIIMQFVVL